MPAKRGVTLASVRALALNTTVWDGAIPGFGARKQKSDAATFILKYRTAAGRQRLYTIGRFGAPWTPDTARTEALRLLGEIVRRADPMAEKRALRGALTVGELCDRYLVDAEAGRLMTKRGGLKKQGTLKADRYRIGAHIKPALGRHAVAAVTRADVETFLNDIISGRTGRGGRTAAARTVGLLGGIFTYAVRQHLRPDNPVHGVTRPADGKRTRRLADAEYALLDDALRQANGEWPPLLALIRFLALTGWRSSEALDLKWAELDLPRRTAGLGDTKTGFSLRPLSRAACAHLTTIARTGDLVFPSVRGDERISKLNTHWKRTAGRTLPADVTPHTLRHSFASLAADLGLSEPVIAALVGHKRHSTTSRYVHSADAALLAAADAVADHIAALMNGGGR
jgi:integrase